MSVSAGTRMEVQGNEDYKVFLSMRSCRWQIIGEGAVETQEHQRHDDRRLPFLDLGHALYFRRQYCAAAADGMNQPSAYASLDGTNRQALSLIPERRSSKHVNSNASMLSTTSRGPSRQHSASGYEYLRKDKDIRSKGSSTSPIRKPDEFNLRKAPSRTFVPAVLPTELLDNPTISHARVNLAIRLYSPVYMGGATVEGSIHVLIDGGVFERKRKQKQELSLNGLSVTLIGIERCKSKQEIFRALTTELIDQEHPPPDALAPGASEGSWNVVPSDSILPFRVHMPMNMGPPPYKSKRIAISYLLCATMELMVSGKESLARQSREIVVLTVHDPEKALVNLHHPLSVCDQIFPSRKSSTEVIKLIAGLHRQTWISGYPVFVDIHIDNRSNKDVTKIEMQLERTILFHDYPAPSANTKASNSLRVPDHLQRENIFSTQVSDDFPGVRAHSQDFRTCQMQLPTGLVSIETGRYFGVRFFLNIQISCYFSKHLKVQLPISIVHPNSIDIPPNALAQVAASIQHKHRNTTSTSGTGSPYRYAAGQAFKAARRRSYIQLRKDTIGSAEMDEVTRMLEGSPRKSTYNRVPTTSLSPKQANVSRRQSAIDLSRKQSIFDLSRKQSTAAFGSSHQRNRHHRVHSYQQLIHPQQYPPTSFEMPSRSNTNFTPRKASYETVRPLDKRQSFDRQTLRAPRSSLETKVLRGLRNESVDETGPRLQRSTSGLGFDDTSTEIETSRS